MLDLRHRGRGVKPHQRHCVVSLSKNINHSFVLVQPRKTRPFITERRLTERKKTNLTNNNICFLLRKKKEMNYTLISGGLIRYKEANVYPFIFIL